MRYYVLLTVLFFGVEIQAQTLPAYQIFTSSGKKTDFAAMAKSAVNNDVVLFGELHDDPIAHWLELELAKMIHTKKKADFKIGAEMFELHQAKYLDAYLLSGNIQQFKDSAKLWSNFETDYAPLLTWAQENKVPYYATNVTRKYASLIFKKGITSLDTLSASEKALICPLPFPFDSTLTQYAELIAMGKEMHATGINFALAQAVKDATMAHSICRNLENGQTLLHLNGAFHSDYHQGIMWYIENYRKGTKVLTISTVLQGNLDKLDKESVGKADFIIAVPTSMTRTM